MKARLAFAFAFAALVSIASLIACQGGVAPTQAQLDAAGAGIIGGQEIKSKTRVARQIVAMKRAHQYAAPTSEKLKADWELVPYRVNNCAGALIGKRLVLTAAHCLPENELSSLHFFFMKPDGKIEQVVGVDFIVHPQAKDLHVPHPRFEDLQYDIALVKLAADAPKSAEILILPRADFDYRPQNVQTGGLGQTNGKADLSEPEKWRSTAVSVLDYAPSRHVFEVDQRSGHGFCQGDSGAPALLENPENPKQNLAFGIASYNRNLSTDESKHCTDFGDFINVQSHASWIQEAGQTLLSREGRHPLLVKKPWTQL